jgi:hypothetical protein
VYVLILLSMPPEKIDAYGKTETAVKMPKMQIQKQENPVSKKTKAIENVNSGTSGYIKVDFWDAEKNEDK